MSQGEQQFAGPRQLDHQEPIHSLQSFVQSVLYGKLPPDRWMVQLSSPDGESRVLHYLAASADEAETMADHEATAADPTSRHSVRAMGVAPRRGLWDARWVESSGAGRGAALWVARVAAEDPDQAQLAALSRIAAAQRAGTAEALPRTDVEFKLSVERC